MQSKIYLWIEDRKGKSSYQFWETMIEQLCPNVVLESKKNNSELVKAVKQIDNVDNQYIVVFDNSFDNQQIYQEHKRLKNYADTKKNVFLMDIICFEYILLEFDNLIDWIYAPNDIFLTKRADAIRARKKLVEALQACNIDYKVLREVMEYDSHLSDHNIEQLCAKLLFDLTRNTGFVVSKATIGNCWITSCCEWNDRQADDICGLDNNRLSVKDKMKCIYNRTLLRREFSKVGLEVLD